MIRRPELDRGDSDCSLPLLSKLALDDVNEQQSAWLAEHLDGCAACCQRLEDLMMPIEDWRETRTVLISETKRNARPTGASTDSNVPFLMDRTSEAAVSPSFVRWLEPAESALGNDDPCIGSLDGFPIRRILGVGGMGVVLDGWDPSLCRTIAIKAMHPHLAANGTAKQRFVREARSAAAVLHPNVVAIHSVHAEHDPPYLIMPLIAGESLQARIDRDGPLEIDAALRVATQIADGLSAAHAQGLIHRDIKPANILLEHGTERAMLTDFGVVRALNDATVTASGVIAGTPEYMSPEQAGGKNLNARSDLFSLGSVLYTMLVGHPPFRADSALAVLRRIEQDQARLLIEHRVDTPASIQVLLDWMLEKDPDQRIDSATELADVLRSLLAHRLDPQRTTIPEALTRRATSQANPTRSAFRFASAVGLIVVPLICFFVGRYLPSWNVPVPRGMETQSLVASQRDAPAPTAASTSITVAGPLPTNASRDSELLDREVSRIEVGIDALERDLIRPSPPTPLPEAGRGEQ